MASAIPLLFTKDAVMENIKRLILKYETMLDTLIIMDDYDGGEAKMLRTILKDLKDIAKNE